MASLEDVVPVAIHKLVGVVEHLVNTHVLWTSDMSKEEAVGILDELKSLLTDNEEKDETDPVDDQNTDPTEK